jgi:predicted transcriptional regulator
LLKKYHVSKLELNGFFETKIIEEVDFCMVITDKEASISFSRSEGDVNIDQTFFGKNESFLEWCNDLFDSVWSKGNVMDANLSKKFKI